MESPFRSEEAAFRFLLITIGAFALIVLASWISTALGFLTFLGLVGCRGRRLPAPARPGTRARSTSSRSGVRTSAASSSSRTRRSGARSS